MKEVSYLQRIILKINEDYPTIYISLEYPVFLDNKEYLIETNCSDKKIVDNINLEPVVLRFPEPS